MGHYSPVLLKQLGTLASSPTLATLQEFQPSYDDVAITPSLELLRALQPFVPPGFLCQPTKHAGSLAKIRMDPRFAKPERQVHSDLLLRFPFESMRGQFHAQLVVRVTSEHAYAAAETPKGSATQLRPLRNQIATHPGWLTSLADDANATLDGEQLARSPAGYPQDHPAIEELRYAKISISRPIDQDDLFGDNLVEKLATHLRYLGPAARAINQALADRANAAKRSSKSPS